MKVKDVLTLIGDQCTLIEIDGGKTYDFNAEMPGELKVRRSLFVNYRAEDEEKEEVMNKEVVYITSDKPGVMKILAE